MLLFNGTPGRNTFREKETVSGAWCRQKVKENEGWLTASDLWRRRALVWHFGFSKEKPREQSENINEDVNERAF